MTEGLCFNTTEAVKCAEVNSVIQGQICIFVWRQNGLFPWELDSHLLSCLLL